MTASVAKISAFYSVNRSNLLRCISLFVCFLFLLCFLFLFFVCFFVVFCFFFFFFFFFFLGGGEVACSTQCDQRRKEGKIMIVTLRLMRNSNSQSSIIALFQKLHAILDVYVSVPTCSSPEITAHGGLGLYFN